MLKEKNMESVDFNAANFNEMLGTLTERSGLNFCKMLHADPNKKLSVIAEFKPSSNSYVTLNKSLKAEESACETGYNVMEKFYYGASPRISSALIRQAISELRFTNEKNLDEFISRYHDQFMLHPSQSKYLLHLARYIVVSFSLNFGIRIQVGADMAERLISECDPKNICLKRKDDIVTIHGCPTDKVLKLLSECRFEETINNDNGEDTHVWVLSEKSGIDIRAVYANIRNVGLIKGHVLYSGVLLRPVNVEFLPDNYENCNITSIKFSFEKSTYATVFALDNNFTEHPVLSKSKKSIIEFFNYDDRCKLRLNTALEEAKNAGCLDSETLVCKVGEYLRENYGVNQIGVSANIITNDEYLILGMRSSNSIDGGHLYPGANGNAEVRDKDVSFYSYSVYEDFPTISIDSERIDFIDEINREAYAELGLDLIKQDALCYGITISGTMPDNTEQSTECYRYSARRMHFNVLFEENCNVSLMEIVKNSQSATESFENKEIVGVKLKYHKNIYGFICNMLLEVIKRVAESKDIIESLSLVLLLVCLRDVVLDLQTLVSLLVAIIIVSLFVVQIVKAIIEYTKKQKHILKCVIFQRKRLKISSGVLHIFKKHPYNIMARKIQNTFGNRSYHPVTAASLLTYINYHAYRSFFI